MRFGVEPVFSDDFIAELGSLLKLHYEEVAVHKDIPLEPNWEWYKKATAAGALRAYTMRTDGELLIGYAFFTVVPLRHYMSSLGADADVVFLHPKHRRKIFSFTRFLRWCDEQLSELGVTVVTHRSKVHLPALGHLVQSLGYEHVENSFQRRL